MLADFPQVLTSPPLVVRPLALLAFYVISVSLTAASLSPALLGRLATRMGLPPPRAHPSFSDILAFESYLDRLLHADLDLPIDPNTGNSLLPSIGGDLRTCRLSESLALALAHAYRVQVSFVDAIDPTLPHAEHMNGCYRTYPNGYRDIATGNLYTGRIDVQQDLSPEARAAALWHEVGHMVFGHNQLNVPLHDLTSSRFGSRSQEYLANAFAAIMLDQTIPGSHLLNDTTSIAYVFRFESAFELIRNPAYNSDNWDKVAGAHRAQEFYQANRDLLLNSIAEVKQISQGHRPAHPTIHPALIPPDLAVFPTDFPSPVNTSPPLPFQ